MLTDHPDVYNYVKTLVLKWEEVPIISHFPGFVVVNKHRYLADPSDGFIWLGNKIAGFSVDYKLPVKETELKGKVAIAQKKLGAPTLHCQKEIVVLHKPTAEKPYHWISKKIVTREID